MGKENKITGVKDLGIKNCPELVDRIEKYRQDIEYVASNQADLFQDFQNEWIAVYDGTVIAHGEDLEKLVEEIRAKGDVPVGDVFLKLLDHASDDLVGYDLGTK